MSPLRPGRDRAGPLGGWFAAVVARRQRRLSDSGEVGGAEDDAGADGVVGGFVDEYEAAGGSVAAVFVEEQGDGGADADPADLVEGECAGVFVAVQGVDVEPVLEVFDQ